MTWYRRHRQSRGLNSKKRKEKEGEDSDEENALFFFDQEEEEDEGNPSIQHEDTGSVLSTLFLTL
ncbi:hypothetical protein CSUI_000202 [Cystoisospora suis]|uniref:Uncharacterized protein n=1 Tax=Cystoisospora suis TaxID=483139 RepID=A0A2C6LHQ3_9APIC|nr:hypothetical protein CSUI_000202 [Cystoisospora suis]